MGLCTDFLLQRLQNNLSFQVSWFLKTILYSFQSNAHETGILFSNFVSLTKIRFQTQEQGILRNHFHYNHTSFLRFGTHFFIPNITDIWSHSHDIISPIKVSMHDSYASNPKNYYVNQHAKRYYQTLETYISPREFLICPFTKSKSSLENLLKTSPIFPYALSKFLDPGHNQHKLK